VRAMLVCVWAGALAAASAGATLPEDVAVGTRVEVEGTRAGAGDVMAKRVSLRRAARGADEVEAAVDSIDAASRSLVVGGVRAVVDPGAEIRDGDELTTDLARVRAGTEVEAEGRFEGGVLRVRSLETSELDEDEVHAVELEGTITEVDPGGGSFRVLGLKVVVGPQTRLGIH